MAHYICKMFPSVYEDRLIIDILLFTSVSDNASCVRKAPLCFLCNAIQNIKWSKFLQGFLWIKLGTSYCPNAKCCNKLPVCYLKSTLWEKKERENNKSLSLSHNCVTEICKWSWDLLMLLLCQTLSWTRYILLNWWHSQGPLLSRVRNFK